MKQFKWKRAVIAALITLVAFLLLDYVSDQLTGKYEPGKILAAENLFWKILASLVVAGFAGATDDTKKKLP